MTEKQKYIKWFKKAKKEDGLLSVNYTFNPDRPEVTEEEFYAELNHWNDQADNNEPRIKVTFL